MSAPHFFSNFFALVCSTICKETNIKNSGCHFSVFLQNSLFPVFHILGSFEQKSLKKLINLAKDDPQMIKLLVQKELLTNS